MTRRVLRTYILADPFRPFRVTTRDGRTFDVRREAGMACSDTMVVAYSRRTGIEILDMKEIESVELIRRPRKRNTG